MALWRFHEAYKALDLEVIDGYPNKCPMNQFDLLPKFDGNPLSVVAHIVEFVRSISILSAQHEDVCLWLFLLSLENEQRDWIKHSYKPRSISSLTILIKEFLKHWGPESQSLEDIILDLEDAFSREGFDIDPIECLRGTLLREFVETTVEKQEVDNTNEENFEHLKQSRDEDFEFFEQLMRLCPDNDLLVKFCQQREEELDAIIDYYEKTPTQNLA
jgi:hypothetical protein